MKNDGIDKTKQTDGRTDELMQSTRQTGNMLSEKEEADMIEKNQGEKQGNKINEWSH